METMKARKTLRALAGMIGALSLAAGAAYGGQLDLDDPDDVIRLLMKVRCSLNDGETALYWWEGRMYSRKPAEKNRHLFNVQGMNIRHCETLNDPVRGLGFVARSRELMFYLDPETNEILRTWTNPWTGEEVEVVQVANDPPGNYRETWARDEEGNPTATLSYFFKDGVMMNGGGAARLFYSNPLGGDYQQYVGGIYHAMEFGTGSSPVDEILDADIPVAQDRIISWGRVSKWLPWMKMGDRPGVAVFHTAGMRLSSYDELPDVVMDEINLNHPEYVEPPPIRTENPRETSWTVFKDHIDAQRAEGSQAD